MILFLLIIKLFVSQCLCVNVDLAPLEKYLSSDTFESLNMSKEYKPFDMKELDALNAQTRKYHIIWSYRYHWHYNTWETIGRGCYLMAQTYQAAYEEIQKYYHIRFLYVNNLAYEVGYLVHEIIYKYKMMLEIYQVIVKKFYYAQGRHFASVSYMLYMYTNVLEYSMMVIHMCNMLHELEAKYKNKVKLSVFDNIVHISTTRTRTHRNVTIKRPPAEEIKDNYIARVEAEKKKRKKELRKIRQQAMIQGVWIRTTVDRRPKKSSLWPLEYGWSIEYW